LSASDEPFLLFVHTFDAHDPYVPPNGWADRFAEGPPYSGDIPDTPRELIVATAGEWSRRSIEFWERVDEDDPANLQRLIELYDACIAHVDEQVGRLLDGLSTHGVADDTLAVFLSDHGEEFGEHGGFKHRTSYQELLHVPLVMALPGGREAVGRGRSIDTRVRLLDVLPTVLDVAGLEIPEHLQGESMLPLLAGGAAPGAPVVSHWLRGRQQSLRLGDHKLIQDVPSDGSKPVEELYDLAQDPGETHDLLAGQPALAARLRERLDAVRESCETLRARFDQGAALTLDDDVEARLKALGYLGDR
jgi:arylsulfatase A-like enzyme